MPLPLRMMVQRCGVRPAGGCWWNKPWTKAIASKHTDSSWQPDTIQRAADPSFLCVSGCDMLTSMGHTLWEWEGAAFSSGPADQEGLQLWQPSLPIYQRYQLAGTYPWMRPGTLNPKLTSNTSPQWGNLKSSPVLLLLNWSHMSLGLDQLSWPSRLQEGLSLSLSHHTSAVWR